MYRTLGLSATLALGAQAFLVPSTMSLEIVNADSMAGGLDVVNPLNHMIVAPCHGCESEKLLMNVSVGSDPTTLELNGVQFYPPIMSIMSLGAPPAMPILSYLPADASVETVKSNPEQIGKSTHITAWNFRAGSAETVSETNLELLNLDLQVLSLDSHDVSIPRVTIKTIKDTEGRLLIHSASLSSPPSDSEKIEAKPKQPAHHKQCNSIPMLCRLQAIVADRLARMRSGIAKGCNRARPAFMRPHKPHHRPGFTGHGDSFPGAFGPPPTNLHHGSNSHHDGAGAFKGRPHGMRPQNGHAPHDYHRHHHEGGFMRAFHGMGKFMLSMCIAVVIGVLAGMVMYVVGIVVGWSILWVWIKVFRRGGKYQRVALDEEESVFDEDEEEAAPAYDEKEAEAVSEKVKAEAPPVYQA